MPNYLNVETGGEFYGIYNQAIALLEFISLAHKTLIFSFLSASLSSSEFCKTSFTGMMETQNNIGLGYSG